MYRPTKYIVEENQIVKAVKWGLEQSIKDKDIVDRLMRPIVDDLETVLEDDCDKFEWGGEV